MAGTNITPQVDFAEIIPPKRASGLTRLSAYAGSDAPDHSAADSTARSARLTPGVMQFDEVDEDPTLLFRDRRGLHRFTAIPGHTIHPLTHR